MASKTPSQIIAYPFRLLQCCLVTDGGGALILVSAERARDFPQRPVYLLGTGESVETPMVSQMEDFTSSRAFRVAGPKAFAEAGIIHKDVDHLMIYDAFAHLPIYGLEDLGFVPRGEAGRFIAERNTAPGGKLPLNTNGGGLSYMHSGMYALQESVRQMRGTAPAQIPDARISICHGVGGMFAVSGTIIMSKTKRPWEVEVQLERLYCAHEHASEEINCSNVRRILIEKGQWENLTGRALDATGFRLVNL